VAEEEPKKLKKWQRMPKRFLLFFVVLALFFSTFYLGWWVGTSKTRIGDQQVVNITLGKPKEVDFSLYWEAWSDLKSKTIFSADAQKMIDGSIAGMAASLGDPYTTYFNKAENQRFREDIAGEFSGIGVEIIQKDNLLTVVTPLSGSPAEKAGLKPRDIILKVDDTDTATLGFNETINRIRGDKGTEVKLTIARDGVENSLEIKIVRDTIVVKSVELETKDSGGKKILVIKVRQFGDDTGSLFSQIVSDAKKSKPDGIIVDLRNNPGGYLETAVDVSSYFLDGGVVVTEKGKSDKTKEYKTTKQHLLKGIPTVVLINGGSASASEILAGALQDRGAAKIIGEQSFGKGSVQELVELSDKSALKVTVAHWLTPNGRLIDKEGIKPDIEVKNEENSDQDKQLDRAIQYLVSGN
jgi:carboxyl-terminal processing protease